MAEKGSGKLKLLYIKEYLEAHSDENHPVGAEELMAMLEEKGISCERKSIYSDVQTLRDYGMDILRVKAPCNGYYLTSRDFELPELRLLMDAVRAASFITPKKTTDLLQKISRLCSAAQAQELQKQVGTNHGNKFTNEEIYYNIDTINRAIALGKKISFRYCKRKLDAEKRGVKLQEKNFTVSPYALIWSDDRYYLVSNNEKYDNLMHTRIDRMKSVRIIQRNARPVREVSPYADTFDTADYAAKSFHMFSGEMEPLVLVCSNSLLEEILDRFGTDVVITDSVKRDCFQVRTEGIVSEGLVSWLTQFSGCIEVLSPLSLREKLLERAAEILTVYRDDPVFTDEPNPTNAADASDATKEETV